jgi:cytoskeletal protein CcmA (bactofilin family)
MDRLKTSEANRSESPHLPAALEPHSMAGGSTASQDVAAFGRSIVIRGELKGSDSLYIEGRIEGTILVPGQRVTVGRSGEVIASIEAREIVILGKVRGNCIATERLDIRADGYLTGDVSAARISIEDGAYFKGGIEIRKPTARNRTIAIAGSALADEYDANAEESITRGQYVTIHDETEIDSLIPTGTSSLSADLPLRSKVETR